LILLVEISFVTVMRKN